MAEKPSYLNFSHLTQKRSIHKVLKKKVKLERKSFHFLFWKLKNVDSFKTYKSLKLNVEKASK